MLTLNTQIPTASRGQVRALVKAHPDWLAWITANKGKLSAQALNSELLEFALMYPALASQIESVLLQTPRGIVQSDTPETFTEEDIDMTDTLDAPVSDIGTAFDLDAVLGSVDQFLSPLVRSELVKVIAPVIAAANKPAVEKTIEIERIIEVEAGAGPRVPAAPKARRDKRVTVRTLLPSKAKDAYLDTPITLWTGAASPAIDPFYVVDREQMATLLTAFECGANSWLTGHAGTGKSSMPYYACALTGRPIVRIGMTRQTEVESLVGGMALRNSSTVWEDGILIKAMRQPGTVILVDELTFAPAGVQAIFQQICDEHRSYELPTGEVVRCADGVVFVIADNTTGSGDEGGLYAGTNISNAALVTRFSRMLFVDYLSAQKEAEALSNHTACPMPAARHLADFVAQARRMPTLAGVVISLRQMVAFVRMVQQGFNAKSAFTVTIASRMPATERATIEGLAILTWSETFEALVHSKPVPAHPSNSAASQAFGDINH